MRKNFGRKFSVGGVALFLVTLLLMGIFTKYVTASEKKIFQWKYSSYTSSGAKSVAPCQRWWAEQIEKRSNGQIKVKIYWVDELCGPKEMMMAVKSRLADVVGHVPAYTPGETPIWNSVYLPFLAPSRLDQTTVIYNRLGKESKPFIDEMSKFNCIYGGCYNSEGYSSLMGRKPVRSVADLKGVRVRCMPDQGEIFKQFGAIPMTVAVTEMYSALDTNVVDLVAHSRLALHAYKIDEISKYLIQDLDMGAMGVMYLINKDAWNELPDELQRVVQSVIDDSAVFLWDYEHQSEWIAEADRVMKKRGMEIINFPKAEREKLKAKAESVWEAWAKRTGKYENAKQAISDYIRIRDEVVAKYPQGVPGIKYK
jgi:TRAP-type C4-dicarboxylate transport system substrate-binding protein